MSDSLNNPTDHQASPEFRTALERELMRALRNDEVFGPPDDRSHHRLGTIIGIAAGGVFTLSVGLVLGASTGYASAAEIIKDRGDSPLPPGAGIAALRSIPPLIFTCGNLPPVRAAALPQPKPSVPVIDLPPAKTKTAATLDGVLGMRQLSTGDVLVNDAGRRQVKLFDSTLALQAVVRDSTPGSSTSYGPRGVPLIRYLGDSSLLADDNAGSLLVMGPSGQIARPMAPSHPDMMMGLNLYFGAVDDRGRIYFGTHVRDFRSMPNWYKGDSSIVVRADLDTRSADTLARIKTWSGSMMLKSGGVTRFTSDPLPLIDEWALLADGSVAVVRGRDYHIDWIHADGTTHSTGKLPFDWKRLTDDDKQKLIDSARAEESPKMALALGRRRVGGDPEGGGRGQRGSGGGGQVEQGPPVQVEYVPPKLEEMFDFSPPIRRGALTPDLDGNLWILPSSSAQSKTGELVYDVVNVKGDFYRVRVPLGRSVIGFGKGGVVYLLSGDKTNGFYLERTTLPPKR